MSLDKSAIAQLPDALAEARLALEFSNPSRFIQHFADLDLSEFVVHRADRAAIRLIPEWVREAHASGQEDDLLRTIRTFAECSLNVKESARRLGVHSNTVYFRLNQIKKRTGVDPRTFNGASLLVTSLRLLDTQSRESRSLNAGR